MTATWPVVWRDTIDSTNEEARRIATTGAFHDQWIAARTQTAGRGRLQREWMSPIGNLYATALYSEPAGLSLAVRTPFAAAVAVAETIDQFVGRAVAGLKWPNDVRVNGAKICGILVEAAQARSGGAWVAAGIGVNVAFAPEKAGQQATSIADLRGDAAVRAEDLLEALRPRFAERLAEARDDFSNTLKAWLSYAEALGETIEVRMQQETCKGVFEGLEADGGLILRLPDGSRRTIRAGDVSLIGGAG